VAAQVLQGPLSLRRRKRLTILIYLKKKKYVNFIFRKIF